MIANSNTSNTNSRILSSSDCTIILEDLKQIGTHCLNFSEKFDSGIKKFDSCSIVQSFYASGEFGRKNKKHKKTIR